MVNSAYYTYKREIDTLTGLNQKVIEQKFFTTNIPDYVNVDEGNCPFSDSLFTWETFDNAGDGFEGFQIDNSNEARMPTVNTSVSSRIDFRRMWNKKVSYKIVDLEQIKAILDKGGANFDFITKDLEARKRNFDLMLQHVAFLGNKVFTDIQGLLNNSSVTVDTTVITASIGSLPDSTFNTLVGNIIGAYVSQNNYTDLSPNRFLVPYNDWLLLTQMNSVTYPMMSKLEYLEKVFKQATANEDFKILRSPYAESSINNNNSVYALYRKDPDVLVLDIPVGYRTTAFGTPDNYTFYNVGYGQVGGVRILRPQEIMYFEY